MHKVNVLTVHVLYMYICNSNWTKPKSVQFRKYLGNKFNDWTSMQQKADLKL